MGKVELRNWLNRLASAFDRVVRLMWLLAGDHARSVPHMKIEAVFSLVERAGLVPRGVFHLADDEREGPLVDVSTIVLIGVTGRSGWDAFASSRTIAVLIWRWCSG